MAFPYNPYEFLPKLPTFTLTQRNIVAGIGVLLLFTFVRNLPWEPFRTFSSLPR